MHPCGTEPAATYDLPKLSKKIVYLDQFAISNMMKAINPRTKAYQSQRVDPFWRLLFEKLDRVSQMQLIVCPESSFHRRESMVAEHYEDYRRMYHLLSGGLVFRHQGQIKRMQVYSHAKAWILGKGDQPEGVEQNQAFSGDIDAWQDRIHLHVNQPRRNDWTDDLNRTKAQGHTALGMVFQRWQAEQAREFADWYEEECLGFGKLVMQSYTQYVWRAASLLCGLGESDPLALLPGPTAQLFTTIQRAFRQSGVEEREMMPRVQEYLASPYLRNIPFVRIGALMFAALAKRAARGRQRPPNAGMYNDIEMISVLLPYCDAMLIDRECHGLLDEPEVRAMLGYTTVLYSARNKAELQKYLDQIDNSASAEHIAKIREVYGEDWPEPFTTLYTYGHRQQE